MANQKLTQLTPVTTLEANDLVYVVTDTATTPASKGITVENLTAAVATSAISSNPVENNYVDTAAMIADQSNQTANFFQVVNNADYYEYLGTTAGTIADYRLLSDTETTVIIGNNTFKTFNLTVIQADSSALTTISGGNIGFEYDSVTDLVTGVFFNSAFSAVISRLVALDSTVDYYVRFYNGQKQKYDLAKVTGFATVNTNFVLASVEGTIDRTNFDVADRLQVDFDIDAVSLGNTVLDRTGTALTFDSDAFYNKDTYLTTGNLTLSDTSAVNGRTGVIWCNGYVPTITGLTYIIAEGFFSSTKLNIASFNYVNSTNYKAEVRVTSVNTLTAPTLTAVTGDSESVLSWGAESNADNYVIQRSLDNFATAGTQIYSGSLLTFTDTGLTNGTVYYYRGLSEGTGEISSGLGAIISNTPAVVNPYLANLVASYNLNSGATDFTGNHNGTAANMTYATAKVSNGGVFNGTNGNITLPDSADFEFTDGAGNDTAFTISHWVNFTSKTSTDYLIDKGTSCWRYSMTSSTALIFFLYDASGSAAIKVEYGQANFVNSNWYHVVVTYDGSELASGLKMYVNGVDVGVNTSFGTYNGTGGSTVDPTIGSQFNDANFLDGSMDEVHIWKNRELTQLEVTDIYTLENAGTSIL
jgi:hypothetical protein